MKLTKNPFPGALLSACALCAACYIAVSPVGAQTTPKVTLTPVITSGLSQPVQIVHANDGTNRLFVVQQRGTIKVFGRTDDNTFEDRGVFFEIEDLADGSEQGLLSLAFDPGFSENGRFYVFYTNSSGHLELARYETGENPDRFDPATGLVLITIPHPTYTNHNGGEMHFGPDGFLYLSTGDGGSGGDPSGNSQNPESYLGKLLRLDVNKDDLTPEDNPLPGSLVYASGLRNPFRWSFDRTNQNVWLGDVGQNGYEEVNFIGFNELRGANFGWRCYEGDLTYNSAGCGDRDDYIFPAVSYPIGALYGRSVIGGVVYRGTAYPSLSGYYIGADYSVNKLHLISRTEEGLFIFDTENQGVTGIADFGEAENGEVYAAGRGTNTVYRVIPDPTLPVKFVLFTVSANESNGALLKWAAVQDHDLDKFEIQRSSDGRNFQVIGSVSRKEAGEGETVTYSFQDPSIQPLQTYYYRIRAVSLDASFLYSSITSFSVTVLSNQDDGPGTNRHILPSIIEHNRIRIVLTEPLDQLELITASGQFIQKFDLSSQVGEIHLNTGYIPPGLYLARFTGPGKVIVEKAIFP